MYAVRKNSEAQLHNRGPSDPSRRSWVLESPLEFTNRSIHLNCQISVAHLYAHLHVEDDDDEEYYGDEDDRDTKGQEGTVRADGKMRLENIPEDAGDEEEEATTTGGTMR